MSRTPFRIRIEEAVLSDLHRRLAATRWLEPMESEPWQLGADPGYLQSLCEYWRTQFDWRSREAMLNSFSQYRAEIDGVLLHFLYEPAKNSNGIPLLLVHGWPDSFVRFLKLIPLLTASGFDVIVPSLPGYGFSGKGSKAGVSFQYASLFHKLMTEELGYKRYGVQGGDWGGMVAENMGNRYSQVKGIHLTDVPFYHLFQKADHVTPEEKKFLTRAAEFKDAGAAYAQIQATRPQTLAIGLNDSPAGLAGWMVEKFREWSDCDGDVESKFSKDELLTNITIYWATASIGTSFLPYYDRANAGALRWMGEAAKEMLGPSKTPAGFAIFPKDILPPPRSWAERFFNVTRWKEMPRGGHFAAMEEPELLATEIQQFFGTLPVE